MLTCGEAPRTASGYEDLTAKTPFRFDGVNTVALGEKGFAGAAGGKTHPIAPHDDAKQGDSILYAVIGFTVLAATILARRFAAAWRRESMRIDRILAEFDAEIVARTDDDASELASRMESHSSGS
jgi:hypothetical protein